MSQLKFRLNIETTFRLGGGCGPCGQGRRQRKMSEGTKRKIETYVYNFWKLWHTKCSIIFSTPKAWVHSRYINKKIRSFVDSERTCAFVGRYRRKNSQCRMTDVGVWERSPQPPEANVGSEAGAPHAVAILQLFSPKIHIFRHILV